MSEEAPEQTPADRVAEGMAQAIEATHVGHIDTHEPDEDEDPDEQEPPSPVLTVQLPAEDVPR